MWGGGSYQISIFIKIQSCIHCPWEGREIKKVIEFSHNLGHFLFGGFPYQVNICPSCYQSLDSCNLEKKMVTMVVMTRVLVTCSRVVARNKGVFPLISSARFTSHFFAINSWNDFQNYIKDSATFAFYCSSLSTVATFMPGVLKKWKILHQIFPCFPSW